MSDPKVGTTTSEFLATWALHRVFDIPFAEVATMAEFTMPVPKVEAHTMRSVTACAISEDTRLTPDDRRTLLGLYWRMADA